MPVQNSGSNVDPWNSLEIAKLLVSASTPLIVAIFGILIHRATKAFEHKQWKNQKLVEKKIKIYEQVAPYLNNILCYFNYVGDWKNLSHKDLVAMKRKLDHEIYLAAPFFSKEFFEACVNFQKLCFQTYAGWGKEPLLRTTFIRRKEVAGNSWDSSWEDSFSKEISDPDEIKEAYKNIMTLFSKELGIVDGSFIPKTGNVPHNH